MTTPKLSVRLTLERPLRQPDGGGGWTLGWEALGSLWADVAPSAGREIAVGDRPAQRVTHRIILRLSPDESARPRPDQRPRSGDRIYAIRGVSEHEGGRAYLTVWAEEGPFS